MIGSLQDCTCPKKCDFHFTQDVVIDRVPTPLESVREAIGVVIDLCSAHGWTGDARKFLTGAVLLIESQSEMLSPQETKLELFIER